MFEGLALVFCVAFVYCAIKLGRIYSQLQQVKVQLIIIHQEIRFEQNQSGKSIKDAVQQSEAQQQQDGVVTSESNSLESENDWREISWDRKINPKYY